VGVARDPGLVRRFADGSLATVLVASLALAAAAASGCGGDNESSASEFQLRGEWRGRLEQQGLRPFHVDATIRSLHGGAARNTVHYNEIDCSGHWRFLSQGVKDYRFREVIDRGRGGTCKGVGVVRLIPDGEFLDYRFRGGGAESHGVLSRVDG
jgi:hypothetical protein